MVTRLRRFSSSSSAASSGGGGDTIQSPRPASEQRRMKRCVRGTERVRDEMEAVKIMKHKKKKTKLQKSLISLVSAKKDNKQIFPKL